MIRTPCLAFFAALLSAPLFGQEPAAQEPPQMVKESETGILFPSYLMAPRGKETARVDLLGVGVREKTIFKVNVYAMGFYVDLAAAAPVLQKAIGDRTLKQARKHKGFADAFLNDDFAKTLRWVMARDVGGEDIAEAFRDSLEPRLKAAKLDEEQRKAAEAAMKTFRGWFADELTEGTELLFHWEPGARLHVVIGGKPKGVVQDLALCRALFDVYLGADPISSGAKQSFLDGAYAHAVPQTAAR